MISKALFSLRGLARCPFSKLSARGVSWKTMENYYNYTFTNKMEWIDHKKRFPIFRAIDLEGNLLDPKYDIADKETLMKIYDYSIILRECEKVFNGLHRQGRITFYMTTLYEEAIGVAAGAALKPQDSIELQYREQGIIMYRGYTPEEILHAVKGTIKDYNYGKCLVFQYAHPQRGVFPSSAPIGSKIPHAAGAGFHYRAKGKDQICIGFFGDGASSQGDFHAALNFASTLGSQTMFVCRNNLYGISTPIEDQFASDGVAPRGIGYGMPAIKVDGCDPVALFYTFKKAREMIIERKGPVLVETYSYRGGDHSTSDSAALYRTKEVMKKLQPYLQSIGDPIERLGKFLEKKGYQTDIKTYRKNLEEKTRARCMASTKEVDATPHPHWSVMLKDVYAEEPWNLKEQKEGLAEHLQKYEKEYPMSDFAKDP